MLDAGDLENLMSGLRNNNLLNYTHILTGEGGREEGRELYRRVGRRKGRREGRRYIGREGRREGGKDPDSEVLTLQGTVGPSRSWRRFAML